MDHPFMNSFEKGGISKDKFPKFLLSYVMLTTVSALFLAPGCGPTVLSSAWYT